MYSQIRFGRLSERRLAIEESRADILRSGLLTRDGGAQPPYWKMTESQSKVISPIIACLLMLDLKLSA